MGEIIYNMYIVYNIYKIHIIYIYMYHLKSYGCFLFRSVVSSKASCKALLQKVVIEAYFKEGEANEVVEDDLCMFCTCAY